MKKQIFFIAIIAIAIGIDFHMPEVLKIGLLAIIGISVAWLIGFFSKNYEPPKKKGRPIMNRVVVNITSPVSPARQVGVYSKMSFIEEDVPSWYPSFFQK